MNDYSVILFHSGSNAMWTSKLLKKNTIDHKIIPIPRNLSSDCGYCVRINTDDADKAREIIEEKGIEYDRIVGL